MDNTDEAQLAEVARKSMSLTGEDLQAQITKLAAVETVETNPLTCKEKPDEMDLAGAIKKLSTVDTLEKSTLPTAEDIEKEKAGEAEKAAEEALQKGKEELKAAETQEKQVLPTADDIEAEKKAEETAAEILGERKRTLTHVEEPVEKVVLPSAIQIQIEKEDKACVVVSSEEVAKGRTAELEVNYGLDADMKSKKDAKYDAALEQKVTAWIEAVTGNKKGDQDFGDWLKNGHVLCHLVNGIKAGSVKKINESSMPFKQMENITFFMTAARGFGVPESSMFGTPELYERKDLGSVHRMLFVLGGAVQVSVPEFAGPHLGVALTAESKDKVRNAASRQALSQTQAFTKTLEKGDTAAKMRTQGGTGVTEGKLKDDLTYGLDADLKAKQEAKYDVVLEKEVVTWIEAVTGETRGDARLCDWLKDGSILCNLANKVQPGAVKKVNTSSLAFKQMENITFFMDAARTMGVPETSLFGTPDLYEEKNMGSVITCIYTYGGAIQVKLPDFTPKLGTPLNTESKSSKRDKGLITDTSAGYSANMQVERPTNMGIVRNMER